MQNYVKVFKNLFDHSPFYTNETDKAKSLLSMIHRKQYFLQVAFLPTHIIIDKSPSLSSGVYPLRMKTFCFEKRKKPCAEEAQSETEVQSP